MRLTRTLLTFVVATLVATACSGDSNAPDTSYQGTYGLVSVNGAPLPLSIIDQPALKVALQSGTISLDPRNSFTQTSTLVVMVDGVAQPPEVLSCTGTYTHTGNQFVLSAPQSESCTGDTLTGTLDGNTVTFGDGSGETLVFTRLGTLFGL